MMMMKPEARQAPKVTFNGCLIRGRGRGVWAQAGRPLTLDVTNSLTALDGPVLLAEAGDKVAPGAASAAKFTRSTVLAGGPVVEMHGGKSGDAMRVSGLAKLDVEADKCLFVAVPGAGRPLVDLDGVDPADWKTVFGWQVKDANRYANFETSAALAVVRPGGDGAAKEWTRDDWIANVGESAGADKRFGQVTLAAPPTGRKDLAAVRPADVAAKAFDFADLTGAKALDVGVDPADLKKLPLPPEEPKP
jgi:hypothetical protein